MRFNKFPMITAIPVTSTSGSFSRCQAPSPENAGDSNSAGGGTRRRKRRSGDGALTGDMQHVFKLMGFYGIISESNDY